METAQLRDAKMKVDRALKAANTTLHPTHSEAESELKLLPQLQYSKV